MRTLLGTALMLVVTTGCITDIETPPDVDGSEYARRDPETGDAPDIGPVAVKDVWVHTNELYALMPFTLGGLAIESYTVETGPWFTDAFGPQFESIGTFFAAPEIYQVTTVYPMRDTGISVRFPVTVRGTYQDEWTDHISVVYKIIDRATMNPRWIIACRFLENTPRGDSEPGMIYPNNANEVDCGEPIDVSANDGGGSDVES